MTVIVAGHVCVDLTPGLGGAAPVDPGRLFAVGPLGVRLGGSVANTGRVLHGLGVPVRAAAAIGDDELGELVRSLLVGAGFGVDSVVTLPGETTSYSIVIQPVGFDRTFWHHAGANDRFTAEDVRFDGTELVHVGYPPLLAAISADGGEHLARLFERARDAGVTTSLDMAVVDPGSAAAGVDWARFLERVLPLTDLFSPSLEDLVSALHLDASDAPTQARELARRSIELGAGVAAISAGEAGLFVNAASPARLAAAGRALRAVGHAWADSETHVPPRPVGPVVTTNGAGDASTAGLIAGLLAGWTAHAAAELASRCAGLVIAGRTDELGALLASVDQEDQLGTHRAAV